MGFLKNTSSPGSFILIAVLILGSFYLFAESMGLFPTYIHAWTQTDRIALAQNFQLNGFDFFHPATYNLLTKGGITAVDFPIHDYLIALLSEVFNWDLITTFRWYQLIYSLIGIYFFFHFCLLLTKSATKAVYTACFLFTLPFYVYYQNGFLPSSTAFANFLIGIYFVFSSFTSPHKKGYAAGVFFLTLAALTRSTFLIYLLALFFLQLWRAWKLGQKSIKNRLLPLVGIIIFFTYFLYKQHLTKVYGSMFLGDLLYFKSWHDFLAIFQDAIDRWSRQLLSPYHGILLLILLFAILRQGRLKSRIPRLTVELIFYLLISLPAVAIFTFSFGMQFADHDYYYIDSFLAPFSLLLVILLSLVKIPHRWYAPVGTLCMIFFFYFFSYAKEIQQWRYTPPFDDRIEYAYQSYVNAKKDLPQWGVDPKKDTLLVIDANTTNMPFTIWGAKGYTNLNSGKEKLKASLDSNFTYALMIDSFFRSSVFQDYPRILQELKLLNSNDEISLYQRDKEKKSENFFDNMLYEGYADFDQINTFTDSIQYPWTATQEGDSIHQKLLFIDRKDEFPFTLNINLKSVKKDRAVRLLFSAEYHQQAHSDIRLVVSSGEYYHARYLVNELKKTNEWETSIFQFKIPSSHLTNEEELKVYFWNPGGGQLKIDNLKIVCYQ